MLYVVQKSPLGLPGAMELVGAFSSEPLAAGACLGVGTYYITKLEPDRAYKIGTLLDVEVRVVTSTAALATQEPRSRLRVPEPPPPTPIDKGGLPRFRE